MLRTQEHPDPFCPDRRRHFQLQSSRGRLSNTARVTCDELVAGHWQLVLVDDAMDICTPAVAVHIVASFENDLTEGLTVTATFNGVRTEVTISRLSSGAHGDICIRMDCPSNPAFWFEVTLISTN